MNPCNEMKAALSRGVLSAAALLACAAPAHAGLLAHGSFETLAFADGVNCPGVPLGQSCVAGDSDPGNAGDGLKVGSLFVKGNERDESGSDVGMRYDLTVAYASDPFGAPGTPLGAMDAAGLICAADPSACRDKVYGNSSGTGWAGSAVAAGGGAGVVAGAASSAFSLGFMQSLSGVQVSPQYGVSFLQASTSFTQTSAKSGHASGSSGGSIEQWQVTYGSSSQPAAVLTSVEGGVGWSSVGMQFSATSSAQMQTYMASGPSGLMGGGTQFAPLGGAPFPGSVPEPSALLLVGVALWALWLQRRRQARLS